jgi:hypothetical protein
MQTEMLDEFVSSFMRDTCLIRPVLLQLIALFWEETKCKALQFAAFTALFIPSPRLNYHLFPLPLIIETPK